MLQQFSFSKAPPNPEGFAILYLKLAEYRTMLLLWNRTNRGNVQIHEVNEREHCESDF